MVHPWLASVVGALCLLALPASAASGIEQLRSFIDSTQSGRASFEQRVTAKSGRKPQEASGTMAFSRPGKFRWTYDKPYYQLLVGDGEKLWVHDRDLNQVTVKTLGDALASTPAALLAGRNELERNFELREGGVEDGLSWVDATPNAAEGGFESVRIGFSDGMLRGMVLRDSFGQTTLLRFNSFERNPKLDAAQFRFTPPAGADVIGDDVKK
ncbi:MAG: outer membrane lipoprotein chaperone LolA [Methyloversatilis sp.]|uniref:outer membrane lipoprotein chaperone LolA n=1 Tax=Methyloversatilis sp. TaxID=2569862 RepID=UPI002734CCC1|nr:outer membrane lipoprotein chaperone LolA [Methyloversatilis sp.]MDP3871231.1 outer membrane lipoprotein chaperone LolA [Methyloversatilis sp.]